ncbi:hypothetical protein TWF128_003771 [Orbilia oligospora]|nr:hypothetical protein TWF128_003771 [Orbilia oligospora]
MKRYRRFRTSGRFSLAAACLGSAGVGVIPGPIALVSSEIRRPFLGTWKTCTKSRHLLVLAAAVLIGLKSSKLISRTPPLTDTTFALQAGGSAKNEIQLPANEFGLINTKDPSLGVDNSSGAVPGHIRTTSNRAAKEMIIDNLGNQLLCETTARVRAYALQAVAELLRQQLAEYSLRFTNPNAFTDAGESSSSGVFVSSTESGSRTSLPTAEPGADDDDEEDEDNRKKRSRMNKSSLCNPRARRYACIYFANAMDSKDKAIFTVTINGDVKIAIGIFPLPKHIMIIVTVTAKIKQRQHQSFYLVSKSVGSNPRSLFLESTQKRENGGPFSDLCSRIRRIFLRHLTLNFPVIDWEAKSLNCKRKHIDSSELLNLLKRELETVLREKELFKPFNQALLVVKIVWSKVVDAVMENYPMSENPNDMDMASWKTIFEDIVENTARINTRNGGSDPTPSLVNSTNSASESTSEAAYESFQGTVSPTIPESTIPDLLSGSFFGFDKPQFNELPTWTEPWKFNPFTGEPLGGNSAYLDKTPVEWLSQELSQFINSKNLNTTEAE